MKALHTTLFRSKNKEVPAVRHDLLFLIKKAARKSWGSLFVYQQVCLTIPFETLNLFDSPAMQPLLALVAVKTVYPWEALLQQDA